MHRLFCLLATLTALWAGPAAATVTETWGAKTLDGYGGLSAADIGCSGTLSSVTAVDNLGAPSTFWTITGGNIVTSGGAGHLTAPYYVLTVTGGSCSQTVQANIVANREDFRFLSTDTSTSFQLKSLLEASPVVLAGGDTIMCRDSTAGNAATGAVWSIKPPSNAWGGRVAVTSENPASGTDPQNGQAAEGGNCQIGPLQLADPAGVTDANWPIDVSFIHFEVNCASACAVGTQGHSTYLFDASGGYNWTAQSSLFDISQVANYTDIRGVHWGYQGCYGHTPCPDGATTYGMTPIAVNLSNDRFNYLGVGGQATNANVAGMTNMPAVPLIAHWVVCQRISSSDCLDFMPTGETDIESLFDYDHLVVGPVHPDSAQTYPSARWPGGGAALDGAGTYLYNIVVRGPDNASNCCQAGGVTVVSGGSGYRASSGSVSGTALDLSATNGTCTVPVDVTVSSGGAISAVGVAANAEMAGWGCAATNVITLGQPNSTSGTGSWWSGFWTPGTAATFSISSTGADAGDSQGPPFEQGSTDTFSGITVQNNIYVGTHANGAYAQGVATPAITNNDEVFDVTTLGNPPNPMVTASKVLQVSGSGGGDLGHNFTNKIVPSFSGTAPACAPVTCVSGTGVTVVTASQAAYAVALPNWAGSGTFPSLLAWTSRANAIKNMTPSNTAYSSVNSPGVVLSDHTVIGALWPVDAASQVCWALESVHFDATKNCVTDLGSTVAQ